MHELDIEYSLWRGSRKGGNRRGGNRSARNEDVLFNAIVDAAHFAPAVNLNSHQ
ncbi:MAG TPA: hypothetical protein VF600_17810 [Abditibacteriaceae bacterium]|jgi:hypothetical protein